MRTLQGGRTHLALRRRDVTRTDRISQRVLRATYRLARLGIEIETDDERVLAGIDARLCPLRAELRRDADIAYRVLVSDAPPAFGARPAGTARQVYGSPAGAVDYFEATDELFVDCPGVVRARCRVSTGRVEVKVLEPHAGRPHAMNAFLSIPLLELAKRRGLYPLHAACVARGDAGLLIAGASGAGKSTLSLALTKAGFAFLADDIVFLQRRRDELRVVGLPDQVDVSRGTVAMFPELAYLSRTMMPPARAKHAVRVEELFGVSPQLQCRPVALIVPDIAAREHSSLVALAPSELIRELAPNVLLTDAASSRQHLGVLAELSRCVPTHRLVAGSDLDQAVELLRPLVA